MFSPLALAAALATVPTSDHPTFVMSIDETGRAVCSGPTDQQRIMILDHIERHRVESVPNLDVDYLVDSSETVTMKFRGVPRAARDAIWYAMDLWYEQLEITVPFTLTVYWEQFEENENGRAPLAFAKTVWTKTNPRGRGGVGRVSTGDAFPIPWGTRGSGTDSSVNMTRIQSSRSTSTKIRTGTWESMGTQGETSLIWSRPFSMRSVMQ